MCIYAVEHCIAGSNRLESQKCTVEWKKSQIKYIVWSIYIKVKNKGNKIIYQDCIYRYKYIYIFIKAVRLASEFSMVVINWWG